MNQKTGERTWDRPGSTPLGPPKDGLPGPNADAPGKASKASKAQDPKSLDPKAKPLKQPEAAAQAPPKKGHGLLIGAGSAVAGLAAGAMLMHTGDKISKYNLSHHLFACIVRGVADMRLLI